MIVDWGLTFITSDARLKCQTKFSHKYADTVIAKGVFPTSHVVSGAKGWDIAVSYSTWADSESTFVAGDTLGTVFSLIGTVIYIFSH